MIDAVGQEIHVGDMVAHIIFGNRYAQGSVWLAKVLELYKKQGEVKIFKQGATRASVVGVGKVIVIKHNCKLSNLVVSNDGRLNKVTKMITYYKR